jgi:hypothetical protein
MKYFRNLKKNKKISYLWIPKAEISNPPPIAAEIGGASKPPSQTQMGPNIVSIKQYNETSGAEIKAGPIVIIVYPIGNTTIPFKISMINSNKVNPTKLPQYGSIPKNHMKSRFIRQYMFNLKPIESP